MRKKSQLVKGFGWLVFSLSGCAFHDQGLVVATSAGAIFEAGNGKNYSLSANQENQPILYLDGHLTKIIGKRYGKRISVTKWQVLEGLHGFSTWVGVLGRQNGRLGIWDRQSGQWVIIHPDAEATLLKLSGQVILLEGYLEGAEQIRVLYFRALIPAEGL